MKYQQAGKNSWFSREQVLTIPNMLSLFRIILIPVFIVLYTSDNTELAFAVLLISTLSDVFDGYIARSLGQVTDLGKVLDPIADKLTHASVIICLMLRFKWMRILFAVFAAKELSMLVLGLLVIRYTGRVYSAKWYGKLCTTVTVAVMAVHIIFPAISPTLSMWLCIADMILMLNALIQYAVYDIKEIAKAAQISKVQTKSC